MKLLMTGGILEDSKKVVLPCVRAFAGGGLLSDADQTAKKPEKPPMKSNNTRKQRRLQ
jgi:hypothetical protein